MNALNSDVGWKMHIKYRYRRKQYLVNKRLQLQFAFFLTLQVAIPILLLGASLFIINKLYLTSIQMVVGNNVLPDSHIQEVLLFSVLSVLALLVISGILLVYISIRFTHHIAGPIYKLEKTVDNLVKGHKAESIKFRKTDFICGLADKFNILIEELNKTRN